MNQSTSSLAKRWIAAISFVASAFLHSHAASVNIDGIMYRLIDFNRASVTFETRDSSNYNGIVNLIIPEYIEHGSTRYKVTNIDECAFQNCTTLESLVIPPSIVFIGKVDSSTDPTYHTPSSSELTKHSPFYGCTNLSSVTFLDGGQLILEMNAKYSIYKDDNNELHTMTETEPLFEQCPIKELYFGRTLKYNRFVTSIRIDGKPVECIYTPYFWSSKYRSNYSLEKLTIGPNVTELPESFAACCKSLRSVIIGERIKTIPSRCFYDCGLTEINIGESVDSIAPFAFSDCTGLKTITIPANVSILGDQANNQPAFSSYYKGVGITLHIEDSERPLKMAPLQQYPAIENLYIGRDFIGSWPFDALKSLKSIEMGGGFSKLPENAFENNKNLASVIFNERITEIPTLAFSGCNLKDLPDLKNIKSIEFGAFSKNPIEKLIFNGSIRSVGEIWKMPNLTEISLSKDVEFFGGCSDCNLLTTVNTNNRITTLKYLNYNPVLKNIKIGNSVMEISGECFSGNAELEYLSIPGGVCNIGKPTADYKNNSFSSCKNLKHLRFEDGSEILNIGVHYFHNSKNDLYYTILRDTSLESLYIGRDIWYPVYTSSGAAVDDPYSTDYNCHLFYNQKNLSRVIIGQDVKNFQSEMFTKCINLSEVISLSSDYNKLDTFSPSFYSKSELILYVPKGSKNLFESQKYWKNEKIKEFILYTVESIPLQKIDISAVVDSDIMDRAARYESTNQKVARLLNTQYYELDIVGEGQSEILIRDNESIVIAVVVIKSRSPLLGDSNSNGLVTIGDAVNTSNYTIGSPVDRFVFDAADVNGDRLITIADASGTVNLVLEQDWYNTFSRCKMPWQKQINNTDKLIVSDYHLSGRESLIIDVKLNNVLDYVALQADITLPDGMSITSIEVGDRAINHSLMTKQVSANTIRIVLFNPDNDTFAHNNEPLLGLSVKVNSDVTGDIIINNALAVDSQANEYILQSTGGHNSSKTDVTNVNHETIKIVTDNRAITILNAVDHEIAVYAIDGTNMTHKIAKSDNEITHVVPGVYVVTVGDYVTKVVVK